MMTEEKAVFDELEAPYDEMARKRGEVRLVALDATLSDFSAITVTTE
jgi:hypothetical protein